MGKDWTVTEEGRCRLCISPREWDLLEMPYHFHRFLTEIEDVLKETTTVQQSDCLPALRGLVRKLVVNAYWLRAFSERAQRSHPINNVTNINLPQISLPFVSTPDESQGTAFFNLYDEIGYPLTVQLEMLAPGAMSSIHCHGTWGIVAVLQGQEKNTLWKRQPEPKFPNKIVCVGEKILQYGDIISFVPTAIHRIEAISVEPLVTFNLYGETDRRQRFEFDPMTHQSKHY
ncbi:MAG: cupin [Cyanobacteria bacterium J06621_11]